MANFPFPFNLLSLASLYIAVLFYAVAGVFK